VPKRARGRPNGSKNKAKTNPDLSGLGRRLRSSRAARQVLSDEEDISEGTGTATAIVLSPRKRKQKARVVLFTSTSCSPSSQASRSRRSSRSNSGDDNAVDLLENENTRHSIEVGESEGAAVAEMKKKHRIVTSKVLSTLRDFTRMLPCAGEPPSQVSLVMSQSAST
jgi:hypothetical protein